MWATLFLGLLVASWVWFYLRDKRQKKLIDAATKARQKIELEESRVFDFLHGLGEAFSTEIHAEDLHRLIVEGAIRILDCHGGALYMANREGTALVARFISKSCPPLIEVSAHILQQAETTPQALQSYLRLHAIELGEGILGKVWRQGAGAAKRSRHAPHTAPRHDATDGVGDVLAAQLRQPEPRRARCGKRPDELALYRERLRDLQGNRRAVGVRALQRHRLFASRREKTARYRPPGRPGHSTHPAAVRAADHGKIRARWRQHAGAPDERRLLRLHQDR